MNSIVKIAVTGGPCAGKTVAMSYLESELAQRGFAVLLVPETASELIRAGITPWEVGAKVFQTRLLSLQLEKEKAAEAAAEQMNAKQTVILCDRGAMDNKAYLTDAEFCSMLEELSCNEIELRDSYDAVFHLTSVAKRHSGIYSASNNTVRRESAREALLLDDRTVCAWTGHSHLRVIGTCRSIKVKLKALLKQVLCFLGYPEPYEIERRFLIELPNMEWLSSNPFCRAVEIEQTYLTTASGEKMRLRQRGANGHYVYFKTVKRDITETKRIEIENRLTREQYSLLLSTKCVRKHRMAKTRYCLVYKEQYFEIDVFPFWTDKAIIELELTDEEQKIAFPPEICVIREITAEHELRNAALAQKYGEMIEG